MAIGEDTPILPARAGAVAVLLLSLDREQQLTCDVLTSSRLPTAANENDIVERCPQNVLALAMTLRIHQESRKLSTNASIKSPVHAS